MMSSAYYAEIDPDRRAAFSPTVIKGMLRGDLGFTGVVISDDLAAAAMRDVSPGQRMLRFVRAGGDLAIVGDPGLAATMADSVVERGQGRPEAGRRRSRRRPYGCCSSRTAEGWPTADRDGGQAAVRHVSAGRLPEVSRRRSGRPGSRGPVCTSSGWVSGIEA